MKREMASNWSAEFRRYMEDSGLVEEIERCLACGKCAGGCPVAAITPSYNPRQVIREVLLGNTGRVIGSEEIWRCFWCAGCYANCPSEIKYHLLMLALRYYSLKYGSGKKYALMFQRFVLRAREGGVTFQPADPRKLDKIRTLRTSIGLAPMRVVSEEGRKEYQKLYELTGTLEWLEELEKSPEVPLALTFAPGRITPVRRSTVTPGNPAGCSEWGGEEQRISLIDRERVEKLPIPERMFLFLSCTGSIEYPGTEKAVKVVAEKLGIELVESPDQTCCTGYMLTCNALNPMLALAATARNLSIPEAMGLDVAVFCNGCYGYLNELNHLSQHNPEFKRETDRILAELGREYHGKPKIYHVQEIWYRLRDRLAGLVERPLTGLRVAVHYGCHYLANKGAAIDDAQYPTFMEEIVEILGATPVFYPERRACCGYSVGRGFTHREEVVLPHLAKKMKSAVQAGVELMITVCPGCNVALDREQPALRRLGVDTNIPVIDLSQLVAFALGAPMEQLGFGANTTPVEPVLGRFVRGG